MTRESHSESLIVLTALVALAIAPAGCTHAPAAKASQAAGAAITSVEVVYPERATVRRSCEEPGQVEAYEETAIYAKLSGYVEKWNVDIGSKVKKGQILAVLSVPELDADAAQKRAMVEQAEAKLGQAKASIAVAQASIAGSEAKLVEVKAGIKRAESDLTRWQAEFDRVEQLHKARVQTGSLLDETRSKLKASESAREEVYAQVNSAEAALRHSQATLEQARSDATAAAAALKVARTELDRVEALREYETIKAPYDGVITRRQVSIGDLTEPGKHGEPLFVTARDDVVRITVAVPELYAADVGPGNPAVVRLQALPGEPLQRQVSRTSWTLDPKNRTLRAEIDLPNPKGTLRPGLYAYATIIVAEHLNALTVPSTAVVRENARTYCVAVVDGKAQRKPLTLGLEDGTRTEVLSGLREDDAIVKVNAASLVDGQAVRVVSPPGK
jgi:RND family efflux transporter MFP subunit